MNDRPEPGSDKFDQWAKAWRTLYLPIMLGITGIGLLLFDNILDPPGEMQGTSGAAFVVISFSLGLGLDISRLKGGK